ncbi:hypothetical protein GCWU000324_02887 [Kingella oralis ATCC 51147]|uniref:Uncharacterized protein n=1 Tax=Kingella oralis ATCC 51147 TaxID=629741 RepID=C4GMF3_9NEIS|nr:hypothetical protein GCWU000324_02887 [Kingella oralis ATCC 51147]
MVGIMMVMLGKTGWDMLVQGWREAGVRAIKRCANKHLAIGGGGN